MKVYIQNGDVITVTAPVGGILSGQGVLIGNLFGVAGTTGAEGEPVELATTGVFDLPKDATTVLSVGDRVAWDNTARQVTIPGTGHFIIGVAVAAASNGATTVNIRLDGIGTEAA